MSGNDTRPPAPDLQVLIIAARPERGDELARLLGESPRVRCDVALDVEEAVLRVAQERVDVLLVDLVSLGEDGPAVLRRFGSRRPAIPALVRYTARQQHLIPLVLDAGAAGLVDEEAPVDVLRQVLSTVHQGVRAFSPDSFKFVQVRLGAQPPMPPATPEIAGASGAPLTTCLRRWLRQPSG